MYTKAYGEAPSNTTLTIKYAHGGGIDDNVNTNEVSQFLFKSKFKLICFNHF